MSAAVPVESGRVDHEATAGEHQWEILLYRGTAPGRGLWAKSRSFFIEAQLLATVIGQNLDPSL